MAEELTLKRLRELAGIKEPTEIVAIHLPKKPAEEMKELLEKLKSIWGIPQNQNLTAIDHEGETYVATGVEREL